MRGASADALSDLSEKLGQTRTLADAATMGDQLFGVARVLRAEPALRRVATDASVSGEAKAGLVGNVFGATLGDDALDVLTDAVQRRWTASHDLSDSLERLGAMSLVLSAGKKGSQISDELFAVAGLIEANPELRNALSDPARSVQDKGGLLRRLLDERALPATVRLVEEAASGVHGTVTKAIVEYQHVAAAVHGETLATVRSARELSDAELSRLTDALGKEYDTTVHLHVVVDPELIGGLRIEIGDDVIDGTLASRLHDARRRLAG